MPARKTNAAVSEARTGISAPREKEGSDAGSRDGVAAKVLMDGVYMYMYVCVWIKGNELTLFSGNFGNFGENPEDQNCWIS